MLPLWFGFFILVTLLLALDLGLFNKNSEVMSTPTAIRWTILWVSVGLLFGVVVYFIYEGQWFGAGVGGDDNNKALSGANAASIYYTAYILEKSLSVDNIFVMSLIFSSLKIEPKYQRRVLFWGIGGAIFFRTIMIGGGVWLIEHFSATFYIFGLVLVFSGLRMLIGDDEQGDEEGWFLRSSRKLLPIAKGDHGDRFRARENGNLMLTQLALALIAIELTDVVFAFDSVPAVLAISTDSFLIVTSNIFAIMGLRSLYFVLNSVLSSFHYLEMALAVLLVLIGAKLFAHSFVHVPNLISLTIVGVVVLLGVLASVVSNKRKSKQTV